ncbi:putative membrane-bound dehydrogenase domain-containing protein [Cyclobacterium xiamenense]|uniref:Putative membrane-bound dehydrogenase domain-containing protein n=1 Tax=Cyclobacterium xiamenense TaxID=1297121 RepID=A0A1H7ACH2_9BACT|nr:PVC-type heme-binding CxxCH protein [Cyclobacterium xiamenense]SEJ62244.1 putative membrane-bound dehydrogenase domain-containing protein [Cyclobacterium xiamenense]
MKIHFPTAGLLLLLVCCQQPRQFTQSADLSEPRPSTYVEEDPDPIYSAHVRTSPFQTPEEEKADFILPPGFEVTLFAAEPDITKPINMAFDEKGRLWVSQSSEYPIKAGEGQGRDRISILEDSNKDGRADKITHFAEDLNIPIGVQPVKGGAIGFSIPHVYRFYDTDGDDKADKREILLGPFETRDTHGMVNNLFRGFDGWIHASHGFSNVSTVAGKDGDSIRMVSGNTFRFAMDGSRAEKTSDGRINPFGSDLDELGYHYSADCHTLPIYQLIREGNYTQWGKKEPNRGFAPTMMDYGLNSTALSGLVYYTDTQFPEAYQNSFYSGDVVTCRISRSTMSFNGSTPQATRQADFLVSQDPWFRPVDIKVGPDGALYIADFYNPIIGHYEVPLDHPDRDRNSGRIWKITYRGQQKTVTDWSRASMARLIEAIGNPVLQTRLVATDELVDRYGSEATAALQKIVNHRRSPSRQLVQALWALSRLEALPKKTLEKTRLHPDPLVRVHLHRILGEQTKFDSTDYEWTKEALVDNSPHVRRVAAENLIRHQDRSMVRPLMQAFLETPESDSHLRYALQHAFYHHASHPEIANTVASESWNEEEAAEVALVFSDITSRVSAAFLVAHLRTNPVSEDRFLPYLTAAAQALPASKIRGLIQLAQQKQPGLPLYRKAIAINAGLTQQDVEWPEELITWNRSLCEQLLEKQAGNSSSLNEAQIDELHYATGVSGMLRLRSTIPQLRQLVSGPYLLEEIRVAAARALMEIDPETQLTFLQDWMTDPENALDFRRKMAQSMALFSSSRSLDALGEGMRHAPIELQETIAALLAAEDEGKDLLIRLIREGMAPARILQRRNVEENFLSGASSAQQESFQALTENLLPISQEREQLIAERVENFEQSAAQVLTGRSLYEQHCSMCHRIEEDGGMIGPQLDGIGNWGLSALATKVLDPNRNISENFRTYTLKLKNGQTRSGLFRREEGQLLVMADQTGQEFSVPKSAIAEQTASTITLMPDYFSTTMNQEQFNDLMNYLLSLR